MLKSLLRENARKYGYEIRKAPATQFEPLPIFHLVLQNLLLTHGQQLTFIEIGANDGISGDPLREFIVKYPWKGILVEPQPDVFEKLKSNYAEFKDRVSFENVAISTNSAPLEMYRVPRNPRAPHGGSTIASTNSKTTAKQAHASLSDLEKISVPTATLDSLVQKYGMGDFDILQLDTEGYEWEVLQTLDLSRTRPWLIGFEHGHLTPVAIDSMVQHLNRYGYVVQYGGYNTDSVAIRSDFITI
jgi:FkbM family methyltransferase